jgi:hypothetical protein
MLDHAAVLHADRIEHVDAHRASGRCVSHERSVVGARGDHAQPDRVTVGDEVLDREPEVRERPAERIHHRAHARRPVSVVGAEVLVLDEVGRGDRVHDSEIAFVEAFLDQPAHDVLGSGWHRLPLR